MKAMAFLVTALLLIAMLPACGTGAQSGKSSLPSGTYSRGFGNASITLDFDGDTMVRSLGPLRVAYKYQILDSGTRIRLVRVNTKEVSSFSFEYDKRFDIVTVDGEDYQKD